MNEVQSVVGWLDELVDFLIAKMLTIARVARIGDWWFFSVSFNASITWKFDSIAKRSSRTFV